MLISKPGSGYEDGAGLPSCLTYKIVVLIFPHFILASALRRSHVGVLRSVMTADSGDNSCKKAHVFPGCAGTYLSSDHSSTFPARLALLVLICLAPYQLAHT